MKALTDEELILKRNTLEAELRLIRLEIKRRAALPDKNQLSFDLSFDRSPILSENSIAGCKLT